MDENNNIKVSQAIEELWYRGQVDWKLKPNQKKVLELVYDLIETKEHRKFIVHCSRRFGKSFSLCVLAIMVCLNISDSNVRYASSTQKSVKKMILPIMKIILADCPQDLKPIWNGADGVYRFTNGSELHIAGVNNGHSDDLRGTAAHLAIIDEAAFIDRLQYVTESVLMPQLITTGGILLMSSSSPVSPAHEFGQYIQEAKVNGNYASFDIYQADYEPDIIAEFCKEAGGENSTTWRREYLNELIVDEELQIIPEFNETYEQEIKRDEFHQYYKKYACMDTGFKDKTALIFAYYDFQKAALVVEKEFVVNGREVTSENIAKNTLRIEKELDYKDTRRVADNNDQIFLNDMAVSQGVSFVPTNKDSLHAMVMHVREWVKEGRIIVSPECKQLLGCLKYGVWDKNKTKFDRSKAYGHYDALAALIYMVRNVDTHTNPIPILHNRNPHDWIVNEEKQNKKENEFKKILGFK